MTATKQYNKEYYCKNKTDWKEKYGQMKYCNACNCSVTEYNWSKHLQAKKHIKNTTTLITFVDHSILCDTPDCKNLTYKKGSDFVIPHGFNKIGRVCIDCLTK